MEIHLYAGLAKKMARKINAKCLQTKLRTFPSENKLMVSINDKFKKIKEKTTDSENRTAEQEEMREEQHQLDMKKNYESAKEALSESDFEQKLEEEISS